jgi:hypothetical protein
MATSMYFILGLVWTLLCLGIGLYISGIGVSPEQQIKVGFRTMIVTFLLGTFLLIAIIAHI